MHLLVHSKAHFLLTSRRLLCSWQWFPSLPIFKDASQQVLPLLNAANGGCSCARQFRDAFVVTPTVSDLANVLQSCVDDQEADHIERLNAVAIRFGVVNLKETGAFEAYIADGSAISSLKPFQAEQLKDCEVKGSLDLGMLSKRMGFPEKDGKSWRRPMLIFDEIGNFRMLEPLSIPTTALESRPEAFLKPQSASVAPKEYVFTWQSVLNDVFREATEFIVVFVHTEVSGVSDPRGSDDFIGMSRPNLSPELVISNASHAYYSARRLCQWRHCTRSDRWVI